MDEDEDDIYGSGNAAAPVQNEAAPSAAPDQSTIKAEPELEDGEEEGEELEDDSDSDIDIITERPQGAAPEPPKPKSRLEAIKIENPRSPSAGEPSPKSQQISTSAKTRKASKASGPPLKPGTDYPEVRTSSVDVAADPVYEPAGKPVTEVDFDADLAEHDKPWRRPGSDQSDYFNYGFDEFTWTLYCEKQKMIRQGVKTQTSEFQNMMGGGPVGMPGMPGMPAMGSGQPQQQGQVQGGQQPQMPGGMANMPGMPDMSPDVMNKIMQFMMSQGMDPSQMDFNSFMQVYQQMQGGQGPGVGQQYGGQGGMGGMMDGGGGNSGGGGGGPRNYGGRGRRGRW